MPFSSILFSFAGRLNRAPYWLASIGLGAAAAVLFVAVVISLAIAGASAAALTSSQMVMVIVIGGLVFLFMIWITLALTIKRLHDRDKSAWWVLLFYLAPSILQAIGHRAGSAGFILALIGFGIGLWALVEIGFRRGTAGPNSYGHDPLQVRWPA